MLSKAAVRGFARASSRFLCEGPARGAPSFFVGSRRFSNKATTDDDDPSNKSNAVEEMHDYLWNHMRLTHSTEPIPYRGDLEVVPIQPFDLGPPSYKKVSIVGCGQVGMAIAYAIMNQQVAGSIALCDMNVGKLEGEAKDLEQGSAFHRNVRVSADSDYKVTADSHLVIVTAGVAQKVGESRLSLVERNVAILQSIIPNVLAHSPNAAVCIVSNPCDIMTAVAAKVAGPKIPAGRIFGSGTCLDSSRLRSLIAKSLNNLGSQSVQGYVIGEHGDSSVPVWSSVRCGGVPMLNPPNSEPLDIHTAMHREVVQSAGDVIKKKGYTNWAVGLTNAFIARVVLNDERTIMPLSTCVRGFHDIKEDVFLSLPASTGAHGIRRVIDLPLSDWEKNAFLKSRDAVWEVQKGVWDNL